MPDRRACSTGRQSTPLSQDMAVEEENVDKSDYSQADEAQRSESPLCAQILEHCYTSMAHTGRNEKTGYQEGGNSARSHVTIAVSNVIEHTEPQKGISEAQNCSCDDWRPIRYTAIGGESEPE